LGVPSAGEPGFPGSPSLAEGAGGRGMGAGGGGAGVEWWGRGWGGRRMMLWRVRRVAWGGG